MSDHAEARLTEDISAFYADPLGYVKYVYPWNKKGTPLENESGPDEWQADVLKDIGYRVRNKLPIQIAIASGHGTGKGTMTAWLISWFISTRPHPQIVTTANTETQLSTKTWRELAKWHKLSIHGHWFTWTATKYYLNAHPETWFAAAIPWNAQRAQAFAGTHEKDVMIIMDEASDIADVIWETAEGAMTTSNSMWFAFGNPMKNTGRFRECWGKFRHRWTTRQIDSRTTKKADKKKTQEWVDDYGEDSDFVRMRVRGIFPRGGSNQFIDTEIIETCLKYKAFDDWKTMPKIMGVDCARYGAAMTVFIMRQGRKAYGLRKFRGIDTMQTADLIAETLLGNDSPDYVMIDGVGIGCITDKAEVLTTSGWINAKKINKKHLVYSNNNNSVTIEKVIKNTKEINTRIIANKKHEFSFSHYMPYKTRKEYNFKIGAWETISNTSMYYLQNDFNYNGKEKSFRIKPTILSMPYGGNRIYNNGISISGNDFAAFLGWFLSEGSLSDRNGILISQSCKSIHNKQIIKMLTNMGVNWNKKESKAGEVTYFFNNKFLYNWLKKNCYIDTPNQSFNKKTPQWLHDNSKEVINVFLNNFALGDGYYHKTSGMYYYSTSSKYLRDDLIILHLKIGKYAHWRIQAIKGSNGYIEGRQITRLRDNYCIYPIKNRTITFRKTNKNERIDTVYNIRISGESKLFMVRINEGKPFWVHNGGVVDRLRQRGFGKKIVEVQAGSKTTDPLKYYNKRAEMWGLMKDWLIAGAEIPDDPDLIQDLKSIEYGYSGQGQIQLEKKESLSKRGLPSPDCGDSLSQTFISGVTLRTRKEIWRNYLLKHRLGLRSENHSARAS